MKHKLIFKAIVGSQAQGTATPQSDIDYKGIYMQNTDDLISYGYQEYSELSKDESYYEIKRFMDLLIVANPNAIEILFSPEDCIVVTSPEFKLLYENRHKFLTKKCYGTFAGYAKTQITKARGLDKKMNWDREKTERKDPIDFCYVQEKEKTIPIKEFLKKKKMVQENCGLTNLNHFDNCYAMYYDHKGDQKFKGIIGDNSNEVRLSEISKDFAKNNTPIIIYYNNDKYSAHCRDYKDYCVWLNERNVNRYHTNKSHGQLYDSKNLSHCTRLIDVAREIAETGTFSVRRPNADYLLAIKRGDVSLTKIIDDAEKSLVDLKPIYDNCNLPDSVDPEFVKSLLLQMRKMNTIRSMYYSFKRYYKKLRR